MECRCAYLSRAAKGEKPGGQQYWHTPRSIFPFQSPASYTVRPLAYLLGRPSNRIIPDAQASYPLGSAHSCQRRLEEATANGNKERWLIEYKHVSDSILSYLKPRLLLSVSYPVVIN
jgi:hypothetical protein